MKDNNNKKISKNTNGLLNKNGACIDWKRQDAILCIERYKK